MNQTNDVRITLIRKFNKNPIFDGNLLGLIESYDMIADYTVFMYGHYRYYKKIRRVYEALLYFTKKGDLASIKYLFRYIQNKVPHIDDCIDRLSLGKYYVLDVKIEQQISDLKIVEFLLEEKLGNCNKYLMKICINTYFPSPSKYHLQIADAIIKAGANNFNECLLKLCSLGWVPLMDLLIERGANNFNECLLFICQHDFIRVKLEVIEKGANCLIKAGASNFNECLQIVTRNRPRYSNIAYSLIYAGATNLNACLLSATIHHNLEMMEVLIKVGTSNINECLIATSGEWRDSHLVRYLIDAGATDFNGALRKSSESDNCTEATEELLISGATNLEECLIIACKNQNTRTAQILINYGVKNIDDCLQYVPNHTALYTLLLRYATNPLKYVPGILYKAFKE